MAILSFFSQRKLPSMSAELCKRRDCCTLGWQTWILNSVTRYMPHCFCWSFLSFTSHLLFYFLKLAKKGLSLILCPHQDLWTPEDVVPESLRETWRWDREIEKWQKRNWWDEFPGRFKLFFFSEQRKSSFMRNWSRARKWKKWMTVDFMQVQALFLSTLFLPSFCNIYNM